MSDVHSYKGRLEIQSDGVGGVAGFTELTLIGSARCNMTRSYANAPRRGTEFKTGKTGQIEATITAAITWDDADTVIASIVTAFTSNGYVGVKFLDQETGEGLTADCVVTQAELTQDEDGVQILNVEFRPTFIDTAPAWA